MKKRRFDIIPLSLLGAAAICCFSCFTCGGIYEVIPLSYDENSDKDSAAVDVTCLSSIYLRGLELDVRFHADEDFLLESDRFLLYNGDKSHVPSIKQHWVNDTLQPSVADKKIFMKKKYRKQVVARKGWNDIRMSFNHMGKVFSKPMRLTYRPEHSSRQVEVFSLKPENVVLYDWHRMLSMVKYGEKTMLEDSVRMMLIGECAPRDFSSLVRESMDEKEKQDLLLPRRFLMLTFDRLKGYDVDPFKAAIHAGDTACHVKCRASYKSYTFEDRKNLFRTRELVDNRLPHLLIEITYKDDKSAKSIPPLYLLPGEFISKDGIPVHTDTIEIYGGAKG